MSPRWPLTSFLCDSRWRLMEDTLVVICATCTSTEPVSPACRWLSTRACWTMRFTRSPVAMHCSLRHC